MKILLATGRYFQQNSIPLGCDCMHWPGFYQPLTDINVSQYEMDQKRSQIVKRKRNASLLLSCSFLQLVNKLKLYMSALDRRCYSLNTNSDLSM